MHILLMSDAADAVAGVLIPASFYQLNFATVRKWWCLSDLHHSGGIIIPVRELRSDSLLYPGEVWTPDIRRWAPGPFVEHWRDE